MLANYSTFSVSKEYCLQKYINEYIKNYKILPRNKKCIFAPKCWPNETYIQLIKFFQKFTPLGCMLQEVQFWALILAWKFDTSISSSLRDNAIFRFLWNFPKKTSNSSLLHMDQRLYLECPGKLNFPRQYFKVETFSTRNQYVKKFFFLFYFVSHKLL